MNDFYLILLLLFFVLYDFKTCVIIRGFSQNTTEDALQNYFENTRRSGGGDVEEVSIKGDWARIKFESAEGTVYVVVSAVDGSVPFSMRGYCESEKKVKKKEERGIPVRVLFSFALSRSFVPLALNLKSTPDVKLKKKGKRCACAARCSASDIDICM